MHRQGQRLLYLLLCDRRPPSDDREDRTDRGDQLVTQGGIYGIDVGKRNAHDFSYYSNARKNQDENCSCRLPAGAIATQGGGGAAEALTFLRGLLFDQPAAAFDAAFSNQRQAPSLSCHQPYALSELRFML